MDDPDCSNDNTVCRTNSGGSVTTCDHTPQTLDTLSENDQQSEVKVRNPFHVFAKASASQAYNQALAKHVRSTLHLREWALITNSGPHQRISKRSLA